MSVNPQALLSALPTDALKAVPAVAKLLGVNALATLGLFVFGLRTLPYQQWQRQSQWRHPAVSVVGARPRRQFTGPGDDTITLSGVLHPELTGGTLTLAVLREMANLGGAWPLLEGNGTYHGFFVIEEISETGRDLVYDGTAATLDFSVKLTAVGDSPDLIGQESGRILQMVLR